MMQRCFFLLHIRLLLLCGSCWFLLTAAVAAAGRLTTGFYCPSTTKSNAPRHVTTTTAVSTSLWIKNDDSSQWWKRTTTTTTTTTCLKFHSSNKETSTRRRRSKIETRLYSQPNKAQTGNDEPSPPTTTSSSSSRSCWNPTLRRVMGGIASIGVLETAYLTYIKLVAAAGSGGAITSLLFCNAESGAIAGAPPSCLSVLNGPYAVIPGTDGHVPLALVGLVAYLGAVYLALAPTLQPQPQPETETENNVNIDVEDDVDIDLYNRQILTAWTTTMGIFSTLLMILLLGVLQQECLYCQASAVMSIALMLLCWLGGAIPQQQLQQGIQASVGGGGLVALVAMATILFFNAPEQQQPAPYVTASLQQQQQQSSSSSFISRPGTLVASTAATSDMAVASTSSDVVNKGIAPPPILATSSQRALKLGNDLQRLNARLYGAYWCSHCYDQKERLGLQVMSKMIPYIECSKEGLDSQTALCKEKKVPGYPTWEINGILYPGEQALEELEELVALEQKLQ